MSPDVAESERRRVKHYRSKLKHRRRFLKLTPITMVATNVKSETMALMDEERLGGRDERHHRPPLRAWRPQPFRKSRRFRGLFLLYLSIFDFLSDNMYSEEERERGNSGERKEQRKKKKITVLQTVWEKGPKLSLFKCCGLYLY